MLWDVARKVPSEKLNGLGTPSRFLLEVDLAGTVPRFLVLFFGRTFLSVKCNFYGPENLELRIRLVAKK